MRFMHWWELSRDAPSTKVPPRTRKCPVCHLTVPLAAAECAACGWTQGDEQCPPPTSRPADDEVELQA